MLTKALRKRLTGKVSHCAPVQPFSHPVVSQQLLVYSRDCANRVSQRLLEKSCLRLRKGLTLSIQKLPFQACRKSLQ